MKRSAALMLVALTAAVPAAADLDGDGLDEIGLVAIETDGLQRGPWFQAYDGAGARVLSFFVGKDFARFRVRTMDVRPGDPSEIVLMGILASGAKAGEGRLEARSGDGSVLARARAFEDMALASASPFPVDLEGDGATEIGIGAIDTANGAHLEIWRLQRPETGDGFELVRTLRIGLGPDVFSPAWLAADLNGNGGHEVVLGYSDVDGQAPAFKVVDPAGGAMLASRSAGGPAFGNAQWHLADVVGGDSGHEVVVGTSRRNGAGYLRVFDAAGSRLANVKATNGGASEHGWLPIEAGLADSARVVRTDRKEGAGGAATGASTRIAVGYRAADDGHEFRVWDVGTSAAAEGSPTMSGSGHVLSAADHVDKWLGANFDGDASNGDELVAVFTAPDRSINFGRFAAVDGTVQGAGAILDAAHFDPIPRAIRAVDADRYDLLVVGRRVERRPALVLLDTAGAGTALLELVVLSPGVQ